MSILHLEDTETELKLNIRVGPTLPSFDKCNPDYKHTCVYQRNAKTSTKANGILIRIAFLDAEASLVETRWCFSSPFSENFVSLFDILVLRGQTNVVNLGGKLRG